MLLWDEDNIVKPILLIFIDKAENVYIINNIGISEEQKLNFNNIKRR